jgi:hypothetical protein
MQNTVDHTNVSELANLIGAEYTPSGSEDKGQRNCGDACAVEEQKS